MIVFGITGGSGTGKSTVSELLRESGVYVTDADKIAREAVRRGGDCLGELSEYFGNGILLPDKSLDRRKLAEIVFSDSKKLGKLNEITHKYILASIEKELGLIDCELAAIDGAVIIGSPVQRLCRFMVSVIADYDLRTKRICQRDGISEDSAKKRLVSQPNDKFYIENSRYLIYNNSGREFLENQVKELLKKIRENEV